MAIGISTTIFNLANLPGPSRPGGGGGGGGGLDQIANNYSMELNGIDDYIDCGNPISVQFTNDFTITGWFKTSSAALQRIISKDNAAAGGRSYFVRVNTNLDAALFTHSSHPGGVNTSTLVVNDGEWHFFAFVVEEGVGTTLYIDDETPTFLSETTPPYNGSANLGIGSRQDGQRFFDGHLDEIALFDYKLEASDIQAIFDANDTNLTADLSLMATPPVAWYRMGD